MWICLYKRGGVGGGATGGENRDSEQAVLEGRVQETRNPQRRKLRDLSLAQNGQQITPLLQLKTTRRDVCMARRGITLPLRRVRKKQQQTDLV